MNRVYKSAIDPSVKPFRILAGTATGFVWTLWFVMTVSTVVFVRQFGSNVPSWDDWDMVPTMTGNQPITLDWLWSQHNEHRMPLPRIILLLWTYFFGCDFRAGMYLNVVLLSLLAFAMIVCARRLRGRLCFADGIFPIAFLHWGHAANFLWSWQINQELPVIISGAFLLVVIREKRQFNLKSIFLIGICLLSLPLCCANGVAIVPALILWLLYVVFFPGHSQALPAGRHSFLILAFVLTGLLLVALTFVGYQKVPYHPVSPGLWDSLKAGVQLGSLCFGPAAIPIWKLAGLSFICFAILSVFFLFRVLVQQPEERIRAAGLILFLGAYGALTFVLGSGRPFTALEARYALFFVPPLCCLYFIWTIYGPIRLQFLIRNSLFVTMGLALSPNMRAGLEYGNNLRSKLQSFECAIETGHPAYWLINRYGNYLHPHQDILTDYLPMLRQANVGIYRHLRDEPVFHKVSLPLVPPALNDLTWKEGIARATGSYPFLVFSLPENRYVCGIRLHYSYPNNEDHLSYVSIYWKKGDQKEFTTEQFSKYSPTGDRANWERGTWCRLAESERTLTVWICDTVKEIRIHPDFQPCECKISEIVLLEPSAYK